MNYHFGDSDYTIHVDDANGNDVNDGKSFANAKKTINSALTACPDGGVIVIWPATYSEQLDLLTAAKTITLLGMSRSKSIITQSGSNETIPTTYDGCKLQNLTVKQTGTKRCVHISGKDSLEFIDCDFICSGDMVIDASAGYKASFKNCYLFGEYNTIFMGEELIIDGCVLVTDGTYAGSGSARIIRCVSGTIAKILVKDSILTAQPSYRKPTGKSPELYQSDRGLYCIYGNTDGVFVVLENSILIADGSKPTGAHASSYAGGNANCVDLIARLVALNCQFFARTDQNQSATDAYGISNSNAELANCLLDISGTDKSYDFDATTAKMIQLVNTKYNSSQIGANVTVNAVPAGMTFEKAAKSLVNKAVQNKNTGAIDYYDDDGQTILLTHTPIDEESTVTRTPS